MEAWKETTKLKALPIFGIFYEQEKSREFKWIVDLFGRNKIFSSFCCGASDLDYLKFTEQ